MEFTTILEIWGAASVPISLALGAFIGAGKFRRKPRVSIGEFELFREEETEFVPTGEPIPADVDPHEYILARGAADGVCYAAMRKQ